jgi:EF-P beta-lysylation protein EpmB
MIPHPTLPCQTDSWQKVQARAIHDPAELLALLELPASLLPAARRAAERFPLRVPRGYVARMQKGDPTDPLLRQVLPLGDELDDPPGFGPDPVGDLAAMTVPGLLHKYHGRVLLITTPACAVHCRYCFRRAFPYQEARPDASPWVPALAYIDANPDIEEVILSGGDPLSLGNERLGRLLEAIRAIPHVRRLRIHSRQPIVLPERIDAGLLNRLGRYPLPQVMVVHCNHPQELDGGVIAALKALRETGLTLLNQAVLLHGINDRLETQIELSERLFDAGVLPYYLHQLDRVSGASHFEVPDRCALDLMERMRNRVPGYLLPRLVRETAGLASKTPVESRSRI